MEALLLLWGHTLISRAALVYWVDEGSLPPLLESHVVIRMQPQASLGDWNLKLMSWYLLFSIHNIFFHFCNWAFVFKPFWKVYGSSLLKSLSTTEALSLSWKWKITQLCPTLCNPVNYTVHGILQARILEWVAFPFSRRSSQPRDQTQVSHIADGFFTSWATREAQEYWSG